MREVIGVQFAEALISYSDILYVPQERDEVLDTESRSGLAQQTTAAPATTAAREIANSRAIAPIPACIAAWNAVCSSKAMTTTRSAVLVSAIEEDHRFLGRVFSQEGWMLHKTRSLESAMDLLRCNPVPVVVTERDLPAGNWKDVLAAIQRLPQTPLLIVTARLADEYLWAEVLNLGGYDVLSQPFQVTELLWVFSNAWRMRKDTWTRERCSPGNNESLISEVSEV